MSDFDLSSMKSVSLRRNRKPKERNGFGIVSYEVDGVSRPYLLIPIILSPKGSRISFFIGDGFFAFQIGHAGDRRVSKHGSSVTTSRASIPPAIASELPASLNAEEITFELRDGGLYIVPFSQFAG